MPVLYGALCWPPRMFNFISSLLSYAIRKEADNKPRIVQVTLRPEFRRRVLHPRLQFREGRRSSTVTSVTRSLRYRRSESYIVARVPEAASTGEIVVNLQGASSAPYSCDIGIQMADGVHPVGNPAVDQFATCMPSDGSRGQKTPSRYTKSHQSQHQAVSDDI